MLPSSIPIHNGRFTPRRTGYALYVLDKDIERTDAEDDPNSPVGCWRLPQPVAHTHEDHEINVVVGGFARFRWVFEGEEQESIVSFGQMLAIPGGVEHIIEVDERVLVRGFWIHPDIFRYFAATGQFSGQTEELDRARAQTMGRLTRMEKPLPPRLLGDPGLFRTLQELFEQSQAEMAREDAWQDEALTALGRLSAITLLRLFSFEGTQYDDSSAEQRVLRVRAWMERNYLERVTLSDLAERATLSVSRFSAVFQQVTGFAPKAYLLHLRLQQGTRLLATTTLPISQVAEMIGMDQLSYFNDLFKRHLGCTPTEYRKKHQKERENRQDAAAESGLYSE